MTAIVEDTSLPKPVLYIGDAELVTGTGGEFEHRDPSTGQVQAHVPLAGAEEVDRAVAAARDAFKTWKQWKPEERRRVLTRIGELMRKYAAEFVPLQAKESGIPVATGGFFPMGIEWTEYAASWADKLEGKVVPSDPTSFDYALLEPIGVVAVILTWNGPAATIGMSVIPPLAAGCCVVLKPSELAPFSATRFGQICAEAGLPAGVVSILPGTAEAGAALVSHPGVDKVSFTGGVTTSRLIAGACAQLGKPLLLELGGKSANVVFPDADVDLAVLASVGFMCFSSGQACTLPSRHLVHRSVYDEFCEKIVKSAEGIRIGNAIDPTTVMGPVISATARDRVLGMIDRAKAQTGARLLTGGGRVGGELESGYFIEPTIFGNVDPSSELAKEEVFGPVLSVLPFDTEEEAVSLANDSEYGLAAYVYTKDVSRALRVASELDAGSIGINGGTAPAMPGAPFGGVKQSGYGRTGGLEGVLEFVRRKNVMISL